MKNCETKRYDPNEFKKRVTLATKIGNAICIAVGTLFVIGALIIYVACVKWGLTYLFM